MMCALAAACLAGAGDYLAALLGQRRIAVLADDTVASLYLDTVTAALEDAGFAVCSHIFPSGEGRKNLSTLTELLEFLASEHLTRTDCVAALGGRRHWGHGGLCCRRVPPGASGMSSCPPPCWRRWTPPWGVRPPWT